MTWGDLEPDEPEGDRSLTEYGVDPDDRTRETRIDEGDREFGVDDRETRDETESEQAGLFPDTEDDQQTLDGDDASTRPLFETEGDE